jgi:uncharacterized protein (DUF924 family)
VNGAVNEAASVEPRDVLDFWFNEVTPEQRFAKDDALDRRIAERFGGLRDAVLASGAQGWRDTPEATLAAIILLDQCSRNIHRGQAEAFAADPLARELTLAAIERGWEARYTPEQRKFLYLPLMHAEDVALQALSVEKFASLGDAEALDYARDHRDVQARYGRFPSRNAALGRTSSPDEQAYLSQPDAGW